MTAPRRSGAGKAGKMHIATVTYLAIWTVLFVRMLMAKERREFNKRAMLVSISTFIQALILTVYAFL